MSTMLLKERVDSPNSSLAQRARLLLQSKREVIDAKDRFLLEYMRLTADWRLAYIKKEKDILLFLEPIDLMAKVGEKLGFSEDEIHELTVYVRDTYLTEVALGNLIDHIEEKTQETEGKKN